MHSQTMASPAQNKWGSELCSLAGEQLHATTYMHDRPTPNYIKPFSTDLRKSQGGLNKSGGPDPSPRGDATVLKQYNFYIANNMFKSTA